MPRTHESTEEFAASVGVTPATVRQGFCRNGHYLGIVPVKLPNRRLMWPIADRERVVHGDSAKPASSEPLAA